MIAAIVIAGTQRYGKVDQVPGLFHVATEFFHIDYLPLAPTRSYLILDGTDQGIRIRMSGKSILFAWLRVALFLAGVIALVAAVHLFLPRGADPIDWSHALGTLALSASFFYLFWGSYRFTRAGPLRALELSKQVGIAPEVLAQYFVDCPELSDPQLVQPGDDFSGALPADPRP
jgi:hypothetical protein